MALEKSCKDDGGVTTASKAQHEQEYLSFTTKCFLGRSVGYLKSSLGACPHIMHASGLCRVQRFGQVLPRHSSIHLNCRWTELSAPWQHSFVA